MGAVTAQTTPKVKPKKLFKKKKANRKKITETFSDESVDSVTNSEEMDYEEKETDELLRQLGVDEHVNTHCDSGKRNSFTQGKTPTPTGKATPQ